MKQGTHIYKIIFFKLDSCGTFINNKTKKMMRV